MICSCYVEASCWLDERKNVKAEKFSPFWNLVLSFAYTLNTHCLDLVFGFLIKVQCAVFHCFKEIVLFLYLLLLVKLFCYRCRNRQAYIRFFFRQAFFRGRWCRIFSQGYCSLIMIFIFSALLFVQVNIMFRDFVELYFPSSFSGLQYLRMMRLSVGGTFFFQTWWFFIFTIFVEDVRRIETFLLGLSPDGKRHPYADNYLKEKFPKIRDELTRRLFHIYRKICFDNKVIVKNYSI